MNFHVFVKNSSLFRFVSVTVLLLTHPAHAFFGKRTQVNYFTAYSMSNTYIDMRPIAEALEHLAHEVKEGSMRTANSWDQQWNDNVQKKLIAQYDLNQIGKAIGIEPSKFNQSRISSIVREYGVTGLKRLIEDRIVNLQINALIAVNIQRSLEGKPPVKSFDEVNQAEGSTKPLNMRTLIQLVSIARSGYNDAEREEAMSEISDSSLFSAEFESKFKSEDKANLKHWLTDVIRGQTAFVDEYRSDEDTVNFAKALSKVSYDDFETKKDKIVQLAAGGVHQFFSKEKTEAEKLLATPLVKEISYQKYCNQQINDLQKLKIDLNKVKNRATLHRTLMGDNYYKDRLLYGKFDKTDMSRLNNDWPFSENFLEKSALQSRKSEQKTSIQNYLQFLPQQEKVALAALQSNRLPNLETRVLGAQVSAQDLLKLNQLRSELFKMIKNSDPVGDLGPVESGSEEILQRQVGNLNIPNHLKLETYALADALYKVKHDLTISKLQTQINSLELDNRNGLLELHMSCTDETRKRELLSDEYNENWIKLIQGSQMRTPAGTTRKEVGKVASSGK